jgi:hypothetical protein
LRKLDEGGGEERSEDAGLEPDGERDDGVGEPELPDAPAGRRPAMDSERGGDGAADRVLPREERERGRSAAAMRVRQQRGAGLALVVGGIAPLLLGGWFIGTDASYASQGVDSGTWAAMGTPMMVGGAVLEIAGIAAIATAGQGAGRPRVAARLVPALAPSPDGLRAGIVGRF